MKLPLLRQLVHQAVISAQASALISSLFPEKQE